VTWISWGAVALGVVLLIAAVMSLPSRLRPLRRALRRLSWRQADLDRLQARAQVLQERAQDLAAQAETARQARAASAAAGQDPRA
jgi:hypothetical protein